MQSEYENDCVGAKEARNKVMQQMHTDVMAVLNKEQQANWNEFIKDKKGPHEGHQDWGKNPPQCE